MTKNKTGEQPCPYNIGDSECARCGWNPTEAYRRRVDLKQKGCAAYGQQVEKV